MTDLADLVADDVARLADIGQRIRDLTEQADEIKTRLRPLGAGKFRHDGRDVLQVGEAGEQFDPKLAAKLIPEALQPSCSKLKLDGPTAKQVLPPALYAQCCTPRAAAVKAL